MDGTLQDTARLAAATTRKSSLQTYYTIRLLVDRDRVDNAFRTYAYFRWVDDWIDRPGRLPLERMEFVRRQAELIDGCYRGQLPFETTNEEAMLVDLVQSDPSPSSGLACYIRNLLATMAFDAERRGRLITATELNNYTLSLAVGVTEAIHYFIGHGQLAPGDGSRYAAVTGAHIAHMLRDTREDLEAGFFNIPTEYLDSRQVSADEVETPAYREWVRSRVELARSYFRAGREFVAQVGNPRCRLAYFAYVARFETVLNMIEQDGWLLRPSYRERKSPRNALRMAWSTALSQLTVLGPR